MNTKIILKIDTLKNLVEWIGRNFVYGYIPTNVRALYMFANKPGTSMENDGYVDCSKFDDEDEAEEYFEALSQSKCIIESELVDQDVVRDDTTAEVIRIAETWKITVTPGLYNTEDAFVAYCPRPYKPE